MFFIVNQIAVPEDTFFAAIKRHVVHGDPCAEYKGFVVPEDAEFLVGSAWTKDAATGVVTASECWKHLKALHDEMWVVAS